MSRRAPRLDLGTTRRQRGWPRDRRDALPGLHWTFESIVRSGRLATAALDELRPLWVDHGNVGALRDALAVCRDSDAPMPVWAATALDQAFDGSGLRDAWSRYEEDLVDFSRFGLFQIAHAHGLSRPEAAAFVAAAERANGRPATTATVLRTVTAVRKRAAANPGRYYVAATASWPSLSLDHAQEALVDATADVQRRRGRGFVFITLLRVSRKTQGRN